MFRSRPHCYRLAAFGLAGLLLILPMGGFGRLCPLADAGERTSLAAPSAAASLPDGPALQAMDCAHHCAEEAVGAVYLLPTALEPERQTLGAPVYGYPADEGRFAVRTAAPAAAPRGPPERASSVSWLRSVVLRV